MKKLLLATLGSFAFLLLVNAASYPVFITSRPYGPGTILADPSGTS